jgi:hypothetical protein
VTSGLPGVLLLPDAETLADLATVVGRAKRVDPDGAARLVGHGDVLAVTVSPLHGGGGPTVLGMRILRLATPTEIDVTVPLAALTDRFARGDVAAGEGPQATAGPVGLSLPPAPAVGVAWAGMSPPRRGWQAVGAVDAATLRACAGDGIAEVAAGSPPGSGAAAVAALRGRVWGRPLSPDLPDLPSGVAFVADALGFLVDDEPAAVFRYGSWWRVTCGHGHVLARATPLL